MITAAAKMALNAIRVHGVIRTTFDSDPHFELMAFGLIEPEPVEDNDDALDWRLTKGREA